MEGGGASYAAQQEPREQPKRQRQVGEEEEKARADGGGGGGAMKFRVSARAPHGVGALLLIGGAVLAGAAVVVWRRHALRGGGNKQGGGAGPGAESRRGRDRQPAKHEGSDGGVVEDGKSGAPAPEITRPDDNPRGEEEKTEIASNGLVSEILYVQSGAPAQEIDRPDDNPRGEEEKTGIASNGLDNHGVTSEIQEVHDDDAEMVTDEPNSERVEEEKTEIASNGLDNVETTCLTSEIQEVHDDVEMVADESNSERVEEKIYLGSRGSVTEISVHHDVFQDSEHVERFDQNSNTQLSEATTHDMGNEIVVEKADENSTKDTENGDSSTKNDTENDDSSTKDSENDDSLTKNDTENDDSSTNNDSESADNLTKNGIQNDQDSITNHIENENTIKDNEDVEASDQCSLSISRPVIVLDKQPILHTDCAQEAESMENSPTAQLMMHQEQLLDDMTMDTEAETAEAKLGEGTVVDKDVCKNEEEKEIAEPVGLAGSPPLSSLVKPTEKKEPELSARIETGMKVEQDYTNGGLKDHGVISKGGATTGGGMMTMDRRSPSMAILVLMFVLIVGIAIAVRLYAPPRATKLQIDLQ